MRICLVAESYPPALGGVEFALQKLVDGFIAGGHEVRVITSSWQRHAPGIETHGLLTVFRTYSPPILKRFWFILFSLPGAIRAARWADIVQGSTFAGGPPAFLAAWLTGRKKVLLVHEVFGRRWFRYESNLFRSFFYYAAERIIVRLPFNRYVAVSQYTKESLQSLGVSENKIDVIYHGDSRLENPSVSDEQIRDEHGFSKNDYLFLLFGRTGLTKGFEYFVDAIPEIFHQLPHTRFILILSSYDTRIWAEVTKTISSLPSHVCQIVPQVSRDLLAAYLSASDCVVVPSLSEGFGFCALEACNAHKTVVATNAGALPEVIFGKHVFVDAGSVQSLIDGCVKAVHGETAERAPKVFDWERTVSRYCAVYQELLEE